MASAKMEDLLPQLLSFPPYPEPPGIADAEYDASMKALVALLQRTPASVLTNNVPGGGNIFSALDPCANSVPYLYALLAHIDAISSRSGKTPSNASPDEIVVNPTSPVWTSTTYFLQRFESKQVRYAGNEFRRLVETVARSASSIGKPLLAVHPIRSAILRLDPSSATFTSTHALFVKMCLKTRMFRAALPILDKDILSFPSTTSLTGITLPSASSQSSSTYITVNSGLSDTLNYTDVLEYNLHGAMIYIGLKNWERARQFLSMVITAPTQNVATAIMVEAYKKWILVSLLLHGRTSRIPPVSNHAAIRSFHGLAKAYERIADVFKTDKLPLLQQEIEAGNEIWREDNNTGLMSLVLAAHSQFSIRNLERIYSTLPISQIHQRLHPAPNPSTSTPPTSDDLIATESQLLSMISSGSLNATLAHPSSVTSDAKSQPSTVLHFTPPQLSEAAQLAQVDEQIQRTVQVTKHIRGVDRNMENSKEYLQWLIKARAAAKKAADAEASGLGGGGARGSGMGGGGSHGLGSDAMDMEWGEGGLEMDEDMMAGIQGGESSRI